MQNSRESHPPELSSMVDELAMALCEQALATRPKPEWVIRALADPIFTTPIKRARTGADASKAFQPGTRTHDVVVRACADGAISVLALLRPDTGPRGSSIEKMDLRALRKLSRELGPLETAWVLFACPRVLPSKVVREATENALEALRTATSENHVEPDSERAKQSGGAVTPVVPSPQDDGLADRVQRLEQQVRSLLEDKRKKSIAERDREAASLPTLKRAVAETSKHAARIKSLEDQVKDVAKSIEAGHRDIAKSADRETRQMRKRLDAVEARTGEIKATLERLARTTQEHAATAARLGARIEGLESALADTASRDQQDEVQLTDRVTRLERVIDAIARATGDVDPPHADSSADILPALGEREVEVQPVVTEAAEDPLLVPADYPVPPPFARSRTSDGDAEIARIRAARELRRTAANVVRRIGVPDHFVVDGHNVVIPQLTEGDFRTERDAREWLISQVIALADALDLPDVYVLFDTASDTQWPEHVAERVRVQYCGPDCGKADGRIAEIVSERRADASTVVCTSDHRHVWAACDALRADGFAVRCVERHDVFDLLLAIERYLAAYEDLPAETRMELVREELEEVEEGAVQLSAFGVLSQSSLTPPRAATAPAAEIRPKPREDDHEARVQWYSELIALEPQQATLYIGRAKSLYALKRKDDALRDLENARRIDPNAVGLSRTLKLVQEGTLVTTPTTNAPLSAGSLRRIAAWAAAVREGDQAAATAQINELEREGYKHPYLTLARAADAIAGGHFATALETLSRFDVDPYAGPNMKVQVGLLRLLAHAASLERIVEDDELVQLTSSLGVPEFDVSRSGIRIYLDTLATTSDVLAQCVRVIDARLSKRRAPEPLHSDAELLRRAGQALAEGNLGEATVLYDVLEGQGLQPHHRSMNRAMIALASGRYSAAEAPIREYESLVCSPIMRLQARVLSELRRALEGDEPDIAALEAAAERADGFAPNKCPLQFLARFLRLRGGSSAQVMAVLEAARL